jgi:hypothetical protein
MLNDYINLIRQYPRYLAFSCLRIFFSSPGQSFSFALFTPSFATAFGLRAAGVGLLYSAATLTGAGLLPIIEPIIDRCNLHAYSVAVGLLMTLQAVKNSCLYDQGLIPFSIQTSYCNCTKDLSGSDL